MKKGSGKFLIHLLFRAGPTSKLGQIAQGVILPVSFAPLFVSQNSYSNGCELTSSAEENLGLEQLFQPSATINHTRTPARFTPWQQNGATAFLVISELNSSFYFTSPGGFLPGSLSREASLEILSGHP